MPRSYRMILTSLTAVAVFVGAGQASASTILVSTESGIVNDGNLDWGVLGAAFAVIANPFTVNVPGIAGLTLTASEDAGASFQRRDQGNGWAGNFGAGERLLWTATSSGPMDFLFNSAITGFGMQIQAAGGGAVYGPDRGVQCRRRLAGFLHGQWQLEWRC